MDERNLDDRVVDHGADGNIGVSPANADDSVAASRRPVSAKAQSCIAWVRDYAATRVNSRLIDERRTIPPHVVLDFGNAGLLGLQVPLALGGKLGLSFYDALKVQRQVAAVDLTLAFFCGGHNILGTYPIVKFASASIQQRYLPDLAAGRVLAGFALTEVGAGSQPHDIKTTARLTGEGELTLDGAKVWSGSAGWAGLVNVVAKLVSARGEAAGHVALCVPTDTKGLRLGAEALTTGLRGMVQNAIYLEGVRIGSGHLLGPAGNGLVVASEMMMAGRLGIAASCAGAMWRALQLAGRYARRRTISSARLIDSDLINARIASMYAAAHAADDFVDKLAVDRDKGVSIPAEAYLAIKVMCSEWLGETVDAAIQILGGRGYIETNHLPRMMRDARITRLFEGPTDTLLIYIGQCLLSGSSPLAGYIERRLGSKAGATALVENVERVRALVQRRTGRSGNALQAALGQIASLRLARACTRDPLCGAWLDRRIAGAESALGAAPLSHARTEEMLEAIADRIGDIEQMAPDEDRFLDRYLSREFA